MFGGDFAAVLGEYSEHRHLAEAFSAPCKWIPRKSFGKNVTDERFGTASRMAAVKTLDDGVPIVLKVVDELRKGLLPLLILLFIYRSAEADKGIEIILSDSLAHYALIWSGSIKS